MFLGKCRYCLREREGRFTAVPGHAIPVRHLTCANLCYCVTGVGLRKMNEAGDASA